MRDGLRPGGRHLLGAEHLPRRRQHRRRSRRSTAAPTTCSPTRCRSTASRCASSTRTTPEELAALVDDKTRLVFAETIGNPTLNVVDIRAWADAAHAQGLPLVVDNTVPTPILVPGLRPRRRHRRALGDEVHRRPRHLDRRRRRRLRQVRLDGARRALPGPDEARPLLPRRRVDARRSGRPPTSAGCAPCCCATPAPRSRRSTRSCSCRARDAAAADGAPLRERARRRAAPRGARRRSTWVNYPGLESSPYKRGRRPDPRPAATAALVTFGIKGGREAGQKFIESLELFSHLANIGDAKSLAIHNADHDALAAQRRRSWRRPASRRTRCGCRSGSSTSTTSSATSTRRSRRPPVRRAAV